MYVTPCKSELFNSFTYFSYRISFPYYNNENINSICNRLPHKTDTMNCKENSMKLNSIKLKLMINLEKAFISFVFIYCFR